MNLYHTETQEEYNALMAYVEKKGYEWNTKEKPTEYNCWNIFKNETVIVIEYDINLGFASKEYCKRVYPDTPIKKYKVKQDEVAKWFDDAARNILKYVSRYEHKNSIEDLKKAQFYLNDLINWMESD
ncbi:DUF3310 domain-containing protein [Listeria monocytogenes]|nr:DUF3310 domain-containing protein [Listeria monocytogenes]MBC6120377.1 DUF3310 domain-containing protein [Listeria seeligeri]EDN7654002.1 DUF3310 domain-containing protein [Listeria monocytogenes]EJF9291751.1 DUF3310 domain-containing protein [Listeria monocytogenes]EJF9294862.1 DUF3310 domain-containing protein [Listeria monocytogenes]